MNDRRTTVRFIMSAALLALAMIGLGIRLALLHLGANESIRASFANTRRYEKKLLAGRGTIYDCRGRANILALNMAVKDVCADPKAILATNKLVEVSSRLAEHLGLPVDAIAVKLNRPDRSFAYVGRFVHEDVIAGIRAESLPGVFFRDTTVRYYPHSSYMCHVLGFVNYEGAGSAGVEQFLDKYLRGSPGVLESRVDAFRHELYMERGRYIPALEGADVFLNIDQNVQHIVEKALDAIMEKHKPKAAWAIVQRVRTGELLAMATRPSFDLNKFNTTSRSAMMNRAISVNYEPGSTFKAGIIAIAIDRGTVTADTVFYCEKGRWPYKGRILRDHHSYGRLTVADILKKSSNIGAAKIALTLGNKRMYDDMVEFGIGHRLGVDLPGEEAGILHSVDKWSKISATRIAIGQGVAVTALQMLGIVCTIANDGFLMKPYVVGSVVESDGTVLLDRRPEVLARPISGETAAVMRRLLSRVTERGGTGLKARVDGYKVAGKTGTAQKPIAGGYSSTAYMASFVGFLPAEDPEIGVIVVVDEPRFVHTGGAVAGPAFSEIAGQTVRYLNISPVGTRLAAAYQR